MIHFAARPLATTLIRSRHFTQHLSEEQGSSMLDEPWVAILGGGILSFGGLWMLSDMEISARKAAEEEELVKSSDFFGQDDLLDEPPRQKSKSKNFQAF
jgi:hypothetical protein